MIHHQTRLLRKSSLLALQVFFGPVYCLTSPLWQGYIFDLAIVVCEAGALVVKRAKGAQ